MISCCFLGHRTIYDTDLRENIKSQLNCMIQLEDHFEIMLIVGDDFSELCYEVLNELKNSNAQKTIHIILIKRTPELDTTLEKPFEMKSVGLGDKLITPTISNQNFIPESEGHIFYWMVSRSDILFRYIYTHVDCPLSHNLTAIKALDLHHVDLTNALTQTWIDNFKTIT